LFVIYFPEVLDVVVQDGVVCTPDAVELLMSLIGFLSVSINSLHSFEHNFAQLFWASQPTSLLFEEDKENKFLHT